MSNKSQISNRRRIPIEIVFDLPFEDDEGISVSVIPTMVPKFMSQASKPSNLLNAKNLKISAGGVVPDLQICREEDQFSPRKQFSSPIRSEPLISKNKTFKVGGRPSKWSFLRSTDSSMNVSEFEDYSFVSTD